LTQVSRLKVPDLRQAAALLTLQATDDELREVDKGINVRANVSYRSG
jgi:hypothetical protein